MNGVFGDFLPHPLKQRVKFGLVFGAVGCMEQVRRFAVGQAQQRAAGGGVVHRAGHRIDFQAC